MDARVEKYFWLIWKLQDLSPTLACSTPQTMYRQQTIEKNKNKQKEREITTKP